MILELSTPLSQNSLNKIFTWFQDNQLTLNIDKTCYSVFSIKKVPNLTLCMNNNKINHVQSVKYLGVYLDEKLNWELHVRTICNKIMKLVGATNYISKFINKNHALQIYYAYFFPIIKCGIELYGISPKYVLNRLQATQTRILKLLSQKHPRESTTEMFKDLNILNCEQLHTFFLLLFVYKHQNNLLSDIFHDYFVRNIDIGRPSTRQSNNIYISLL